MLFRSQEYYLRISKDDVLWTKNKVRHRDNGPAYHWINGNSFLWYKNGLLHRLDGPARYGSTLYEEFYRFNRPIKYFLDPDEEIIRMKKIGFSK